MFWQLMETFAPSGVTTVSPSQFYNVNTTQTVIMENTLTGVGHFDISAEWNVGDHIATIHIFDDDIEFHIDDIETWQSQDGKRHTTYQLIQDFIDSLDRIYAFVDGDAWDNVTSINVGDLFAMGVYNPFSGDLFIDPAYIMPPFTNVFENVYKNAILDGTLFHELQHAIDKNKNISLNQKEQNAYGATCQYLEVQYQMADSPNKVIYRVLWDNEKEAYVSYGGDPNDLIWPYPDE
jgi:hypothetical protein